MKLDVNGVVLHYEVCGQGEPLILLHGNGEDHTIFSESVAVLSDRFTCYTPDSRGHGQSSPITAFRYTDMADDIIAMIDRLHLKKPVLYGFSDGGIIGLLVAVKRPDLLGRLIVSGANTHPLGVKLRVYLDLCLTNLRKPDPLLQLMIHQPHISKQELRGIVTPTHVLAGEHDLISERHTRSIASSIPQSRLLLLSGEDHGSYIVHSTKIADLILSICADKE